VSITHLHLEAEEDHVLALDDVLLAFGAVQPLLLQLAHRAMLLQVGEASDLGADEPTSDQLVGTIKATVQPDSIVYTNGFSAYNKLSVNGFHHERIDHSKELASGRNHINGIENFWGFAKRHL